MDASLHKKTASVSGADDIESEIQDLNLRYLSLLQSVLSYLEELKVALTAEQKQKVIIKVKIISKYFSFYKNE